MTAGWISGFVLFFCLVAASAAAGFACLLTLVVVGYIARARARKNVVERDCSSSCACAGHPVAFMGWDGSVSSFYFVQRGYAADFLISNSAKAINLTPDARAVLDAHLYAKVAESRMAAAAAQAEVHALRERQAVEAEHRRIEQERHREESGYQLAVSKLESARGPAGRRAALDAGLRAVRQPHLREQLLIEASKVEAEAALEKAESQKSPAAKRRTLETALEALRNDPVPDELQAKQIEQLEDALAALDAGTMAAG